MSLPEQPVRRHRGSVELGAGGDAVVHHQQVQALLGLAVLAGLLGNWIGAGSTIWCLAAFAAGGCGYAGAAARTVLSRMKALRDAKIDG